MNKRILNLIALFIFLFVSATAYSQAVSVTAATGGLAGAAQVSGTNNIAILGVQLTKAAGGGNTVTGLTIGMTPDPTAKFINARLFRSTDATFDGIVTDTQIATGTISATNIVFTGSPLTNFEGATALADDEYVFIVVDVISTATGSTTPSLANAGVAVSTGSATGSTITGSTYTLTPPQITITNLPTGLAASPLMASSTGRGVFGFSLVSTGTQTVSAINVAVSSTAVNKWGSYALITSGDNDFSTTGDNSAAIGGLSFDASSGTHIAITGLSESITTSAKNYFLVVDINSGVTAATTAVLPSLPNTNITSTPATGTVTGSATGTNYSFAAAPVLTIAPLPTGLAGSPLVAGATGRGVLGFSLTSTGTQTVSALNVQVTSTAVNKWGSYALVLSTDNSFATTGDNSTIGGLSFDDTSGTHIAITGLTESITSTGKNYFLVVTINGGVSSATSNVQPSLGNANVSATPGTIAGSATGTDYAFTQSLTIAPLSTGLAPSPLYAGAADQGVFGFSLTSSGSSTVTTINVQVTNGSPVTKWVNASYALVRSADASFATPGDNTIIPSLTFTPNATQIAITGLSEVITTGTNYFLVVTVATGVTSGTTTIQASLNPANIAFTGAASVSGTASGPTYSFSVATASFVRVDAGTAPVILGTELSAGSLLQVLAGFSVTSNGGQTITAIDFNYNAAPTAQFPTEYLYRSTTAGSIGSVVSTDGSPDGNFNSITENINSTTVYYYLVVDVANSVNSGTASVQVNPTVADITVSAGNKNAFPLPINRTFTFATSQLSNIILNTVADGTTANIDYITKRTATTLNSTNSASLATFTIQDGGGAADNDNAATVLTGLQIQLQNTGAGALRRIALFDGGTIIAGTQQDVSGSTVTWSSLTLSAGDGGTKDFTIRATFINGVMDNTIVDVTIQSATALTTGSRFAAGNAGGASSATAADPDANRIEVIASSLVSTGNPPNTAINTDFALGIRAVDAQNNLDLDFNGQAEISTTGATSGILSNNGVDAPGLNLPLAPVTFSGGVYNWSLLRLSQSGTYTLTVSDDAFDDVLASATATVIVSSSASGITQATTTPATMCYGTAFFPLGDIVITETDPAGISGTPATSYTFSIALPSGFVFNQSITNPGVGLQATGSDITVATGPQYSYPSANVVQFSFTYNGAATLTTLSIRGLQVGRPHPGNTMPGNTRPPALSSLDITRSGGSANIAGVTPGTDLGTLNVSQPATLAEFTVDEVPGDVTIDPGTTSFNVNANSVKLVPSITIPPAAGTNSFAGNGVTSVSSTDYRFNPNSLAAGAYDISYTYTNGSGCQQAFIKTFTVFVSGINGLDPAYCNNAATETGLTVSQTFVDQRMVYYKNYYGTPDGTWKFDYFVYYDPNNGGFRPITNPDNTSFDPKLSVYQTIVQAFGGEMPVGFAVCNTGYTGAPILSPLAPIVPCAVYGQASPNPAAGSNFGVYDTYQWVTINSAPSPTFTLPKSRFCLDDPAVVITGTPPNSDEVADDFFDDNDGALPIVTVTGSNPRVWSFNPAAKGGPGTVSVTYTYTNPATGCVGQSDPTVITINTRPATVVSGNIDSPGGINPETCQGAPIGTFTTQTDLTAPDVYTWYSDAALTNVAGTGNSFAPPNPPVNPNNPTGGSPHNYYVTQTVNGCESNKQLSSPPPALHLTVTVKAAPAAPVPVFPDTPDREFCVGATINATALAVPGTAVKWYLPGTSTVQFTGSNPTGAADLGIPVPTVTPGAFDYEVTQTVSLCESARTPVRVRIKGLPSLSVLPNADPSKICTEGGHGGGSGTLITFSGSDENGPIVAGLSTWTTAPTTPTLTPGALIPGGGTALLNTPTLVPNSYTLRFTHTNTAGCSNFIDVPLTVLPKIIPILDPQDSCFNNFVWLKNISRIQTGPGPSVLATPADVISTTWNFNDGEGLDPSTGPVIGDLDTRGTYYSPEHNFKNLGSKSVTYTMTTTYCAYSGTEQITIHPEPKINFTWRNPCLVTATDRSATTFTATELTTPVIPIASYTWDFSVAGDLNHIGTPGGATPTVNYTDIGVDSVELIVETAAHCRDTIRKVVQILPTYTKITASTGYDQNFNTDNNFWIHGGYRSSWDLGSTMGGTQASDGDAWATGLTGSNNDGEHSWVMSGCFNFREALKPVVSMDIWSETPFGVDGAVFQYNEDGRIEDDGSWKVLGDASSGIEWYDGQGISNSPGNQTANDYGWTGIYPTWRKAIYKLDEVKPATTSSPDSLIVFRVAFGGGNARKSGFAFDNVFIGERSRVVLLENFTNTSLAANPVGIPLTSQQNEKFANPSTPAGSGNVALGEIVKIQYHTAFPGSDPLNAQNQQMNNSRAAFYGITTAPTARVDGGYENGNFVDWFNSYNDDRVLTPSALRISAVPTKVGAEVKINVTITNTTSQSISLNGVNLFTVVVQKQILKAADPTLFGSTNNTEFAYVARQMLPSPAGKQLNGVLAGGATYAAPLELTWSHANGGNAIVIFIQKIDGEDKNVYQAYFLDTPLSPDAITGTEDPEYDKHVTIFPNPATTEVNIHLPGAVNKPTPLAMFDAYGRVVIESAFKAGESSKTISTTNLADGIYMLQLVTPQGGKVVRKVMVKH